jgi:hypothetical protein
MAGTETTEINDEVCGIFSVKKTDILKSLGIESGAYVIEPMLTPEIRKRKLDQESVYFLVKQVEMPKDAIDEPA